MLERKSPDPQDTCFKRAGLPVALQVRQGFRAIVWSTFVLSIITFYAISNLTSALHQINAFDVSAIQLSGEISKKIYQTTSNVYLAIAGGSKIDRPQDQLNEVKMLLASLYQLLMGHPDERVREILLTLDYIEEASVEYTDVLVGMQDEEDPERLYFLLRALSGKGEWLISRSEHMQLRIWEQMGPRLANTERLATLLKVGVAVAFAFAFLFGLLVSRRIASTLIEVSGRIREAAEATHGESERSVRISEEMQTSSQRTQGALQAVLKAFHGLVETSKVSSDASRRIAARMETGADAADMLANRTRVTADASDKTRSTISSLGAKLTLASLVLRETISLVHSSVNVATEARGHRDELEEQMDRVNLVLQSIANIADQTELIALDARIAAARSGEAGKDFGRVAQQVGNLAQMSSTAADEVKTLIGEIKVSTLGVARSLGLSIERIQSLLYQAQLVDEVFKEIKGSFDEILRLMDEVKNAANKGATEAELVQTSMAEILESARQVAKQAGDLAEEMFEVANGAQAAVEASKTVASGIVSQAELAKEQSRLAQQVTCEIAKLA